MERKSAATASISSLGIDGLAAVVTQQYGGQLNEESLFLFCGRRTDRIKALYWTGDGYILLYK